MPEGLTMTTHTSSCEHRLKWAEMWLMLENKSVYSCYSRGRWLCYWSTKAILTIPRSILCALSSLHRKPVWRTAYNTKPHSSSVNKNIISMCMLRLHFPRGCLSKGTAGCLTQLCLSYHHTHSVRTPRGNHRQLVNDFLTKTTVSLGKMSSHVWWFCCCLICSVPVCVWGYGCRCSWRPDALDLQELEFQVAVQSGCSALHLGPLQE